MTEHTASHNAPASELLCGWGRTAPTRATVWEPQHTTDVAEILATAARVRDGRGIVARGLGRSYGDAAQNGGGEVLRCTRLDRILDLDVAAGTCTVESGVSIAMLMRMFVPLGWFPMVVPGTRHVTVGGAIASDIHGKFRHGSFADSVERMTLVTPECGALSVGPADDAFWATAGGMGLTGVVTEATLQLQPVETGHIVVDTERAADVDDCMARMLDGDHRYRYSVAWIDCLAGGRRLGRSVLTRGNHATFEDLPAAERSKARSFAPRTHLRVPRWTPNGLLNPLSIRTFNEFWFRKSPRDRRGEIQTITRFFHPLDAVLDWNRIYGSRGFVQYQFVVPYGSETVVRRVLERLSANRCASFLAVLKHFEHDSRGMLGFPTAGWTLALDVPATGAEVASLLDGLDDLVVEAGGRIYLSKDSRMRAELVPAMYPKLGRWREVRSALDPHHLFTSDMDRRLDLAGSGPTGAPEPDRA
jgi:decaprenylphospho-beta-D-ribofuranose 2-oxidase